MGYGDDIMATAQAQRVFEQTGQRVAFGKPGKLHWSPVFENNPAILQPGENDQAILLPNYPGNRPYILTTVMGVLGRRFIFNPAHRALPGSLHFTAEEEAWVDGLGLPDLFNIVEPHVKGTVSANNKDWGWENWQRYVSRQRNIGRRRRAPRFQLGPPGTITLDGVELIETRTFRQACAVLKRAAWFSGTDGGLHHAAAALGVPGTVIWGGYSHPDILGYRYKFWNYGGGWLGSLYECSECRAAMEKIKWQDVI